MNPKQNAMEIIRFGNPAKVGEEPPAFRVGYLGCGHEGYVGGGHHLPVGSVWKDIWGTEWHREHEGVMGFPRGNPLADLPRLLTSFKWPDPDDERICGPIYTRAAEFKNHGDMFLSGSHRDTQWEKSYMLVGMENMMVYFHEEPDAVRELLHHIMDFQLGIARHYLKIGVEMVTTGDDLGTQQSLLLSPDVIGEFLVPEYRRLFELYKRHNVLISFHSCGHIVPLLPLFMELGINVLNPIQATANDLEVVRRLTAGRLALQGGVSSKIIMDGPVEAIRQEVARRIKQLGRNGGYFCSPDQGMPWPEAHITAFHRAVEEFGAYV